MIQKEQRNAKEIRDMVQAIGQEHLPLQAEGYECTTEMLYDVLLKAAVEGISLEAACKDLDGVINSNTLRDYFHAELKMEHFREIENAPNQALAFQLPEQVQYKPLEAAMDLHDEPFYGKDEQLLAVACRGRAQRGTTHFVRVASAYVIYRQMRLTLAITFVLPEDSTLDVVKRLYQRLKALKLRLKVLFFDKGFCSGPILRYLDGQQQPAVLACPIRGKQGGTRQLCQGRKSYRTAYTFTDGTEVDVAVVATLVPGKDKRRRRKWLLFVVLHLDWPPQAIYRRYRRRFGIECSYRMGREVRLKTTSTNPVMRFFGLGFACLLLNIWAFLRWFVARVPGPGPHRVDPDRFRFQRFKQLVRRAVEHLYGAPMSLPISCPIPSLLKS